MPDPSDWRCVSAWSSGKNAAVNVADQAERDKNLRYPGFAGLLMVLLACFALLVGSWRRSH